jgi:hypothetical protein
MSTHVFTGQLSLALPETVTFSIGLVDTSSPDFMGQTLPVTLTPAQ